MKFEYNKEKFTDLGLIVKHGNVQNVVFFWNEHKDVMIYTLEIYRIEWQYKYEGFFKQATIETRNIEIKDYSVRFGKRIEKDKYLVFETQLQAQPEIPTIVSNKFAVWKETDINYIKRSEVIEYDFKQAKPVCTINVERNKFYHSINDLPCGDYIVCLKVENREGEIFAESMPYYFHIEDAEKKADDRANGIARAAAPNIVGRNYNGNW